MTPRSVTLYKLLLSCPGDVLDLRPIIDECVNDYNTTLGDHHNIRIELKHWKTDSFSQSGDSPQNILNYQLVDECDMCVALFGNRFGTPTEQYGSGTEEEIARMIQQGKQVFLYFVERELEPDTLDLDQQCKVREYRESIDNGLYTIVKDADELKRRFKHALFAYFLDMVDPDTTRVQQTMVPDLRIIPHESDKGCVTPIRTHYKESRCVVNSAHLPELFRFLHSVRYQISDLRIIPADDSDRFPEFPVSS